MEYQDRDRKPEFVCDGYVHVVKQGDTLYKIAKMYDVKLIDLMRLNPYVNVYNLRIGDELCVPSMPDRGEKVYVVKDGDTLSDVLRIFNVDIEDLIEYNRAILEMPLHEGLQVKMPVSELD